MIPISVVTMSPTDPCTLAATGDRWSRLHALLRRRLVEVRSRSGTEGARAERLLAVVKRASTTALGDALVPITVPPADAAYLMDLAAQG